MSASSKKGKIFLIAVNDSDNAKSAFHEATLLAREQDELHVLHVSKPLDASFFPPGTLVIESMLDQLKATEREKNQQMFAYFTNKAKRMGFVTTNRFHTHAVEHGNPGESLCSTALALRADFLVIGQRTEAVSGVSKLLAKPTRVSQYCIDNAPCNVIVIRPSARPVPGGLARQDTQEIRQAATRDANAAKTQELLSAEMRRAAMKASLANGLGEAPTLNDAVAHFIEENDQQRLEE